MAEKDKKRTSESIKSVCVERQARRGGVKRCGMLCGRGEAGWKEAGLVETGIMSEEAYCRGNESGQ